MKVRYIFFLCIRTFFILTMISKYVMKNNEESYEILMYNIYGNRILSYFLQISANYLTEKDCMQKCGLRNQNTITK